MTINNNTNNTDNTDDTDDTNETLESFTRRQQQEAWNKNQAAVKAVSVRAELEQFFQSANAAVQPAVHQNSLDIAEILSVHRPAVQTAVDTLFSAIAVANGKLADKKEIRRQAAQAAGRDTTDLSPSPLNARDHVRYILAEISESIGDLR